MKIWVGGLRRDDLIVASSLGNEEERDNKVPPPYFTNPEARHYKADSSYLEARAKKLEHR